MHKYQSECPVCGGKTNFTSVAEAIGVVEEFGDCEQCSYIFRMAYSPPFEAICDNEPVERIKRARDKKIEVLCKEEYQNAV